MFAVLLGHVMLVALPDGGRAQTGIVRTLVLDLVTPIERVVGFSVNGIASLWGNYFALLDVRDDNRALRTEVDNLRIELARNAVDVREAERLRAYLGIEPHIKGERVMARVIGRDTTASRRTITIDKGSFGGLHANAVVITPDGVVGRVIHAAHFSSLVQLLSDPESAVGTIVESSRVQGIVRGWSGASLRLEHVDESDDVSVGDRLITSGTDQIYPKGLAVGYVSELGAVEDMMRTAAVEAAVDLGRLEEVLCLVNPAGSTRLLATPDDFPVPFATP